MTKNLFPLPKVKTRVSSKFWQDISPFLVLGVLFASKAPANAALPHFSIDPASPTIDGNITSDDVLQKPVPTIFTPASNLGLKDNLPGDVDSLNALSYGKDPILTPLFFSVDRVAIGLPGTPVNSQSQGGDAAGDVYKTLPPNGSNELFINQQDLGLQGGFFGDDLDSVELNSLPSPFTYFSIDQLSATNGFGTNGLADDILISSRDGNFSIFAPGESMGIDSSDDLDALILWDVVNPGELNPTVDMALFTVSTFSTSAFTFSGNPYLPGVKGFLSPADILFTDFTGSFSLFAPATEIGLFPDDEVDALDTVSVSEPSTVFSLPLVLGLGALLTKKPKKNQKPAEKQTDKSA